jgi:hypothetical protein
MHSNSNNVLGSARPLQRLVCSKMKVSVAGLTVYIVRCCDQNVVRFVFNVDKTGDGEAIHIHLSHLQGFYLLDFATAEGEAPIAKLAQGINIQ